LLQQAIHFPHCLTTAYSQQQHYIIIMSEEAKKGLTEEQVADLKEAFAMFDINGDGMFCSVSLFGVRELVILKQRKSSRVACLVGIRLYLELLLDSLVRLFISHKTNDSFFRMQHNASCEPILYFLFDSTILSRLILSRRLQKSVSRMNE
jgi:hypothetical protein